MIPGSLQVLPLFVLFQVLFRPYRSMVQGMNMPQIVRNQVLLMVMINVILNFILIPEDIQSLGIQLMGLGGFGAAIATVIAYISGFVYIRFMTWKRTGIKGSFSPVKHAIAAGITGLILHSINNVVFIQRWYHLVAISLVSLFIYVGILFIIKEFTKEDFHLFIDTLNPMKMMKYIITEVRGKK